MPHSPRNSAGTECEGFQLQLRDELSAHLRTVTDDLAYLSHRQQNPTLYFVLSLKLNIWNIL